MPRLAITPETKEALANLNSSLRKNFSSTRDEWNVFQKRIPDNMKRVNKIANDAKPYITNARNIMGVADTYLSKNTNFSKEAKDKFKSVYDFVQKFDDNYRKGVDKYNLIHEIILSDDSDYGARPVTSIVPEKMFTPWSPPPIKV